MLLTINRIYIVATTQDEQIMFTTPLQMIGAVLRLGNDGNDNTNVLYYREGKSSPFLPKPYIIYITYNYNNNKYTYV